MNEWALVLRKLNIFILNFVADIQFIEADIVLGTLTTAPNDPPQPIMAHPPADTSDISLDQFLTQINEFNKAEKEIQKRKGVKLDFKSIDVFNGSLNLLRTLWEEVGITLA